MVEVRPLRQDDERRYRSYVADSPHSCLYHLPEWRDTLISVYRFRSHYLGAWEGDRLVGVLPLLQAPKLVRGCKLVSLPFSHAVPVLADDPHIRDALVDAAVAYTNQSGCTYLEFKGTEQSTRYTRLTCRTRYKWTDLPLPQDYTLLWDGFTASVKRAIRKAERSELKIEKAKSAAAFNEFYELQVDTRKRQGVPVYPAQLFQRLREEFYDSGILHLYLARLGRRPVAGLVVFHYRSCALYAYGASISDPKVTRLRPNNLLFWRAIRDAADQGQRLFDFGITHPQNLGLLRFKEGWGATSRDHSHCYYLNATRTIPTIDRSGPAAKMAGLIIRHMPRQLYARLTPRLFRRLA